jgi:hypothetical protein
MASIHLFKKRSKLIVTEDVGNVFGTFWNDILGQYVRMNANLGHIQSQLPYDTYPVLHRGMRFIRMLMAPYLYQFFGQNRFCTAICQAELVKLVKYSWTAVIFSA